MSAKASVNERQEYHGVHGASAGSGKAALSSLNAFAARGLVPMFDPERQLFCQRLVLADDGMVRQGISHRYTIMTLLGLRKLELAGGSSSFDTNEIFTSFMGDTSWIRSVGDYGLLLWLVATFAPAQLHERFPRADVEAALDRYADGKAGRTMELAWFLSGLAHAGQVSCELADSLRPVAADTSVRLMHNQGPSRLFGHMHAQKSLEGFLRGRIGSFADQIYPIYALSKYGMVFHVEDALCQALACAEALCCTQGPMGQWWWLYNAETGSVVSRYPVYAVHQQGMGPMGLLALEEATGQCFEEPIRKGLAWIYGENELQHDLRDLSHNVIWRCIRPKKKEVKYLEMARNILGVERANVSPEDLEILYEDWPYELGWLLYAFADRE